MEEIVSFMPEKFEFYLEPFLGGAAVFFHLLPVRAILSDVNAELMNAYRVVQHDVDLLIDELHKHNPHKNDRAYYDRERDKRPETLDPIQRAARTIFLNKTCFNGLYRVNSKGKFNVPFGKNKNPLVLDEENLRRCSLALKGKLLLTGGYEVALAYARAGDLVYLDPPYHPSSRTANFTGYTKSDFGPSDQRRLEQVFAELTRRKCHVLLSNSDTSLVRELYSEHTILGVHVARNISSKKESRGTTRELLVLNYEPKRVGMNLEAIRAGSKEA